VRRISQRNSLPGQMPLNAHQRSRCFRFTFQHLAYSRFRLHRTIWKEHFKHCQKLLPEFRAWIAIEKIGIKEAQDPERKPAVQLYGGRRGEP
jgi:hypothetical protein